MNDVAPVEPCNPVLTKLGEYPFAKLVAERRRREALGQRVLDFGMGDPRERTPAFIREAMANAIPEISSYPTVRGETAIRTSIAGWVHRRFGVQLDPESEILPTAGSKEGIFHTAFPFIDPTAQRRTVVVCEPAYPVYEAGARYAGAEVVKLVLDQRDDFLPDLASVRESTWKHTRILWLNYPHNPTGHEATLDFYSHALELARRHGFIVCADECYADLYFDEQPHSALEIELENLLVYHSLSKRSAMTGYRSGFIAGDERLIAVLARFRPSVGAAMTGFVAAASVAAWDDDEHASAMRLLYRAKREAMLPALVRAGLKDAGGRSTFYLWMRLPEGASDVRVATALLDSGILVTPGSYLGAGGNGYLRLALVPTRAECVEAARTLESELPGLLES